MFHPYENKLLKKLRLDIRKIYPLNLNLKSTGGLYYKTGKNILGYPGMSFIEKDGVDVGMYEKKNIVDGPSISIVQMKTDLDKNFPNLFEKYKPIYLVEGGTLHGGSAVYFYEIMNKYCEPKIISIDIEDTYFQKEIDAHNKYGSRQKIKFILDKSTLDCEKEIKKFLSKRKHGERLLCSFDDDHSYEHTYKELNFYSKFLQSGDVILMQDTWNQGLYGYETSPMLAVYRFLKENPDFELDEKFNKNMELPCNFIYGVIIKK